MTPTFPEPPLQSREKVYELAAGVAFTQGDFGHLNASGYLVPAEDDAALRVAIEVMADVSNANGADGEASVTGRRRGSRRVLQDGSLDQAQDEALVGFIDANTVADGTTLTTVRYLWRAGDPPNYAQIEWGFGE